MSRIPLTADFPVDANIPALAEDKPKARIQLKVPTWHQRDTMSTLLFTHGFVPLTNEFVRAQMIESLYRIYPEEEAEDHAVFLETYWNQTEEHAALSDIWRENEIQRIADEMMGAPHKEATPPPAPTWRPRDNARAVNLGNEAVMRDDRFREINSRHASIQADQDLLTTRLFIHGWSGLETKFQSHDHKVPESVIEQLRGEIGPLAWQQLKSEVNGLFSLDGRTEKNSESPLDSNSSQDGSRSQSGESVPSDGKWTGSNTEPTPPGTSTTATAPSSPSPSSDTAPKAKSRGRTAVH